jgi:Glycosyl hydrolase family 57
MTLRLALCLHFHQPLSERAAMAARLGYRGLITALEHHPELTVNLCLGGSFVHALHWLEPSLLEAVRLGVARGQFVLLGSTYASSLLAACDDWDNAQQLALHRALMAEEFGIQPAVFGNTEHVWDANMPSTLVAAGYRAAIVDGRMLQGAGVAQPLVYGVRQGEQPLALLWADESLAARFNAAAWFHRPDLLTPRLDELDNESGAEAMLPLISLDADKLGWWASQNGLDPRADWRGLELALEALEQRAGLRFAGLKDLEPPDLFLEGLTSGWSSDLDRQAAAVPGPEVFADWPDYMRRSPAVHQFRGLHNAVRNRLTAVGSAWADPGWVAPAPETLPEACATLYRAAIRTYCIHEYRFGCPGIGGKGHPEWEGVAGTFALARAAEIAEGPLALGAPVRASIEDVTGDGEDEILLEDHRHLLVLSHFGGRVVYWFDLVDGAQHVGNPWAVPQGRYRTDVAIMQEELPSLDTWQPPSWNDPPAQDESAPGRRAALMPEWLLAELGARVPFWPRVDAPQPAAARPARRRAVNDFVYLDDQPALPADAELDYRLEEGGVTFLRFFGFQVEMTKNIRLLPDGLRVNYRFQNAQREVRRVKLAVVSEVAPDGHLMLSLGAESLVPVFANAQQPGIRNLRSGTVITCRASRPTVVPPTFALGLLAIEMTQIFEFTLGPGKAETLALRLQVLSEHEQGLIRGGFKRLAEWPPHPPAQGGPA